MQWALLHDGAIRARGSYSQILETAEDWQVLAAERHPDGTVIRMRLACGYAVLPEAMCLRARRAA